MESMPNKPWYREPWPWLLMLAPAAAIVGGAVTVALAVASSDGLVAEDYYKQGLAVNQRLARVQQAQALGLSGTLTIEAATGGGVRAQLSRNAAGEEGLVVTLSHPTRAGLDQRVILTPEESGTYAGSIGALAAGRWHVIVEDGQGRWRLRGELAIPRERAAPLAPGA